MAFSGEGMIIDIFQSDEAFIEQYSTEKMRPQYRDGARELKESCLVTRVIRIG